MLKMGIVAIGVGLVVVVCMLAWPTLALVAFMALGVIKSTVFTLRGFWGYLIDVGLVLITIFAVSKYIINKEPIEGKLAPPVIWLCMFILAIWIWFRLPATREPEIGKIKALVFSIFDMLILLSGILFGRIKGGLKMICRAMIITGLIGIVGLLAFGKGSADYVGSRTTFGAANPLAPADMAIGLMIVTIGIWMAGRTKKQFLLMFVACSTGLAAILKTGSRGPILALLVVFLAVAYFYRRRINIKMVVGIAIAAVLLVGVFSHFLKGLDAELEDRFGAEQVMSGFMGRAYMVQITLEGWKRSPLLGTGPGDFAAQMIVNREVRYPHNLLLEVLNELGIVGFVFYSILMFHGFKGVKFLSASWTENTEYKKYAVIMFGMFLYYFILSFKTGSYAGSNMFYFFWGTSIGMYQLAFSEPNKICETEYAYEEDYVYEDECVYEDEYAVNY